MDDTLILGVLGSASIALALTIAGLVVFIVACRRDPDNRGR